MKHPPEILDLILSFHRTVCAEEFAGNPYYTLYWTYDKRALRELIGLSKDKYKRIKSKLGPYMKRNPATSSWIASMPWLGNTNPDPILVGRSGAKKLFSIWRSDWRPNREVLVFRDSKFCDLGKGAAARNS